MTTPLQALAAAGLNQRIGDFAGLVGLVLVLITLFTSQRQERLRELQTVAQSRRDGFTTELWLDILLACVTVLLFLSGLPLFVDAASPFHPRSSDGPLRVAFLIVWALLLPLIVWQLTLALGVRRERADWDRKHPAKDKGAKQAA